MEQHEFNFANLLEIIKIVDFFFPRYQSIDSSIKKIIMDFFVSLRDCLLINVSKVRFSSDQTNRRKMSVFLFRIDHVTSDFDLN